MIILFLVAQITIEEQLYQCYYIVYQQELTYLDIFYVVVRIQNAQLAPPHVTRCAGPSFKPVLMLHASISCSYDHFEASLGPASIVSKFRRNVDPKRDPTPADGDSGAA